MAADLPRLLQQTLTEVGRLATGRELELSPEYSETAVVPSRAVNGLTERRGWLKNGNSSAVAS